MSGNGGIIQANWPKYKSNIMFPKGFEFEVWSYGREKLERAGCTTLGPYPGTSTYANGDPHRYMMRAPADVVWTVGHLTCNATTASFKVRAYKKYNPTMGFKPISANINLNKNNGLEYVNA